MIFRRYIFDTDTELLIKVGPLRIFIFITLNSVSFTDNDTIRSDETLPIHLLYGTEAK